MVSLTAQKILQHQEKIFNTFLIKKVCLIATIKTCSEHVLMHMKLTTQ